MGIVFTEVRNGEIREGDLLANHATVTIHRVGPATVFWGDRPYELADGEVFIACGDGNPHGFAISCCAASDTHVVGRPDPDMGPLSKLAETMHRDSAAWFPGVHERGHDAIITHFTLGVAGEAGEVADVVKKADICGLVPSCDLHADGKHSAEALASELADVLTYTLALAHEAGVDLDAAYEAKRRVNVERWGDPAEGGA